MGEERIEDIKGTESDIEIVTELGGRDGGIRGKGTARGIGVVEIGEDSFLGKLSFK